MKIKASIGKEVGASVDNCRDVLTKAVLELCKKTGDGGEVMFTNVVILHTTKPRMNRGELRGFETQTIVCDRIFWDDHCNFFIVGMGDNKMHQSSIFLSIDNLIAIYEAMREVVRKL